ncbi:helix-turn-helix transcriptional regulator [Psychrobacillus psychrodurans]|uniref:helix-turn-helix transcriptional regulator n=1 Tax=Psychrobacillus psychrodurans TaxID=126157 RepID=UPI001F4EB1BE|nr:helix-turn-helix transcriptional regulator [Psychrobacillus psychrodurans]MCK1997494.1 helix-turn-helix transcriptional regulator [Psychrobacillus psychrodurans]
MHIGLKIKELRKLKLWTQDQLAEISGVSERTVRRLETTGKAESATLLSILKALDTNLEELENMFNEDDTIKVESKGKFSDFSFLQRIESGKELVRIIASAHQYGYDYHDCKTEEQIENAQGFLTVVADVLDIWDMIEIGQRFDLENDLTKHIKQLEEIDLWVFGDRQVNDDNKWVTAIIEIYSKDNPMIQKLKFDKDLMQKSK